MSIDTTGKNAYANLTLVIQEFENAALKSGRRAGYLAVANGSTYLGNFFELQRKYDHLLDKLKQMGADVSIVEKEEFDV